MPEEAERTVLWSHGWAQPWAARIPGLQDGAPHGDPGPNPSRAPTSRSCPFCLCLLGLQCPILRGREPSSFCLLSGLSPPFRSLWKTSFREPSKRSAERTGVPGTSIPSMHSRLVTCEQVRSAMTKARVQPGGVRSGRGNRRPHACCLLSSLWAPLMVLHPVGSVQFCPAQGSLGSALAGHRSASGDTPLATWSPSHLQILSHLGLGLTLRNGGTVRL